jgi:hypothetical protein
MELDIELAKDLAELTDPEPNACWPNSIDAMFAYRLRNNFDVSQVRYVEGWLLICKGKWAIVHGWLEIAGKIVDVSLLDNYDAACYHPAHAYTYEGFFDHMRPEQGLPLFQYHHAAKRKLMQVFGNLPDHVERDVSLSLAQIDIEQVAPRLRERGI